MFPDSMDRSCSRRSPGRRSQAGFTLVEVMVALIVFAVGTLALATLIPLGTKGVSKSGEHTRASELAASTVERLLDYPYDDADLTPGTHTDAANPYPGDYYITWVVEDNQPIALCKRITVTVRWPISTSPNNVRLIAVTPESN